MNGETDVTLRNLGVLAAIRQNDKLLTEGDFFTISTPTTYRALLRTVYRESREQNMQRVSMCLRSARTFVTSIVAEFGQGGETATEAISSRVHRHTQLQLCTRMIHALSEAIQGLDNLTETYNDDAALLVRIRQLKDEVVDFLETTRHIAPESAAPKQPSSRRPSPISFGRVRWWSEERPAPSPVDIADE